VPNPVKFDVQAGALPEGIDTDPQGLLEAFAARLIIRPTVPWSSFVLGAAQPTSDLGPWFKDGTKLWVWSDALATYIPQVLESASLQYKVAATDPGVADFTLWFDTTSGTVKWSNGVTWAALYADRPTTTAMNAAIAAAVSSIPGAVSGQGAFSARPTAIQNIVFAAPGNQQGTISLGTKNFDPDNCFAADTFTAPATGYYQFNAAVRMLTSGGTPTDLDGVFFIAVNGGAGTIQLADPSGPESTNGRTQNGSGLLFLNAGDTVTLIYSITSDAAVTVEIYNDFTVLSGYRVR